MNKLFVHALLPYFDHEGYDLTNYEQFFETISSFYNSIKESYKNMEIVFVLNHAWELTATDQLNILNEFFKTRFNKLNLKYFIVYSVCLDGDTFPENILKYNFFQNKLVHATVEGLHPTSTSWNNSKFKGLFLTGKPAKFQRIYPIHELFKLGYMNTNTMEWSFHCVENHIDSIAELLNLDRNTVESFTSQLVRNPDNIDITNFSQSFDYNGIPYDHELYSKTSWSIVSETTTANHKTWITEKTYRAILNCHPFLFFAQPGTVDFLKSSGFRTFDYCYPNDYDSILDDRERFDAVIENISYLDKNWESLDHSRIAYDVNHNRDMIYKNYFKEQKNLLKHVSYKRDDIACDMTHGLVDNPANNIINYEWF